MYSPPFSGEDPLRQNLKSAYIKTAVVVGLAGAVLIGSNPSAAPKAPPAIEQAIDYDNLPVGPCAEPHENGKTVQELAESCLQATRNGKAALVTFGVDGHTAEQIADKTSSALSKTTRGIVNLTFEVVPAADNTQNLLSSSASQKGCIDTSAKGEAGENLASTAADRTMSELQEYDFVVAAVGNWRSCAAKKGVTAVAEGHKGRRADIYIEPLQEPLKATKYVERYATATAHETLHLYQLGHAGSIFGGQSSPFESLEQQGLWLGSDINLEAFLKESGHLTYRLWPPDIMSNHDNIEAIEPNSLHVDFLNWPAVELEKKERLGKDLAQEPYGINLTIADAQEGKFARTTLFQPIEYSADGRKFKQGDQLKASFSQLAFVPITEGSEKISGVDIYLYSPLNRATGLLGTLRPKNESDRAVSRITLDRLSVELHYTGDMLHVRETTK